MKPLEKRFWLVAVTALAIVFLAMPFHAFAQEEPDEDAVAIFNLGQDAHEKGELRKAIELYKKALVVIPEFPEAEYQMGTALLALNDPDEAEAAFRRAAGLREDWSLPRAALGAVLVRKGKFSEAETWLTSALTLDEGNTPAYVAMADLRLRSKASAPVLQELLSRIKFLTSKANPATSLWIARGGLERALGDFDGAKKSIGAALRNDPANRAAQAERIEISLAEKNFEGALEDAKLLVRGAPGNDDANLLLARALAASARIDEASKVLESLPKTMAGANELRDLIAVSRQVDPAKLEQQLETDPNNVAALGKLCSLLRLSDPPKALAYCRRAYENEPGNVEFVVGYGAALVQTREYASAVNLFKRILEVVPDNYSAHANLAISLFQLKRFEEAKTEYRWLAEKQPQNAIAHYFLGIVHDQLAEYVDALASYQQFLKLANPDLNKLEIDKVNLRIPGLLKQIKEKKGKR
jgi:tetratricopeptide (TPR) repeat protein